MLNLKEAMEINNCISLKLIHFTIRYAICLGKIQTFQRSFNLNNLMLMKQKI